MPPMNKRERISDFVRSLESGSTEGASQNYYSAFFQLWNAQKYYEAHDVLEQLWLVEKNAELARFYRALIQAAGAFVHLQKNFQQPAHPKHSRRLKPAVRLCKLAEKNLATYSPTHHAPDVAALLELLRRTREKTVRSRVQSNAWPPDTAPKLQ